MKRPDFIKYCKDFKLEGGFTYPGDTETFGRGAALAKTQGLKRIAVNYEILEPGDRSSWPHAHSVEEEFVFILEGEGQVWIDGHLHDVRTGDSIAFPPGTGVSHCLINNSERSLRVLVVGEQGVSSDKIVYPKHPQRNQEIKSRGRFWEDRPDVELGPHDGWSDKKRPGSKL